MIRTLAALVLVIIGLSCSAYASAQDYTIQSITTSDIGRVVAAPSGDTVYRIDPDTGSVTKTTGSGVRLSGGSTRSLVTIYCHPPNAGNWCDARRPTIVITALGSSTGRAGSLSRLNVANGTGQITAMPTPGSSITFTLEPVGANTSKTFWLGSDFPIMGDSSGQPTGTSTAQYSIEVWSQFGVLKGTQAGSVTASVIRGISVSKLSDARFGTFVRPTSGSGIGALSSVDDQSLVTGTGAAKVPSSVSSRATFNVTGEGGQIISVNVPDTFIMTGPSGSLTVTTTKVGAGAQQLSGSIGSAGTHLIGVGGSFPISSTTPTGQYTGTLTVTVQYN